MSAWKPQPDQQSSEWTEDNRHWESRMRVNIAEFDGDTLNSEGFIDWLVAVEEVFEFKEVSKNKRVSLIATKLCGRASAWWQQLKLTRQSWKAKSHQLEEDEKVHEDFIPHNYQRLMYQQLQNLKQGSKSVKDYTTEFYQLIAKNDIQETDDQLVSCYIGGLRALIMDSVNMFDPARPGGGNTRLVSKGVGSSDLKCFNYGKPGHRQSECKKTRKRHLFADPEEWEDDGAVDDEYEEPPVFDNDQYEEEIPTWL
ncbi:reverse transcriptase domain-containing protein [Tanacetum coccineum]